MSVVSYCHLVGGRPLTEEEETLVFTLGWCMEMVNLNTLIANAMQTVEHSFLLRLKNHVEGGLIILANYLF